MRILVSAYACEPGRGSEPGVGWSAVNALAKDHDVWVVTRANNRCSIESQVVPARLRFVYVDAPPWLLWFKRGNLGTQCYYYLWQAIAMMTVQRLVRQNRFDVVHHLTFARYWQPSALALSRTRFVWGPVGGGESMPAPLIAALPFNDWCFEQLRRLVRWLGEHDPWVRLTARRAAVALASTPETAQRLQRLGARQIVVCNQVALTEEEFEAIVAAERSPRAGTFLCAGNLVGWKGFAWVIEAFARVARPDMELRIAGDGRARRHLEALVREVTAASPQARIRFLGALSRTALFDELYRSQCLIHPSGHDSGGWVCVEAMAAARPVVCLRLGGPDLLVPETAGLKLAAESPQQVVRDLSAAIRRIDQEPEWAARLGAAGRSAVRQHHLWSTKVAVFMRCYRR